MADVNDILDEKLERRGLAASDLAQVAASEFADEAMALIRLWQVLQSRLHSLNFANELPEGRRALERNFVSQLVRPKTTS